MIKAKAQLTADQRADIIERGMKAYWCPICKVATRNSWHSLGDGGLFPQNDTEHTCIEIDVADLFNKLMIAEAAVIKTKKTLSLIRIGAIEARREIVAGRPWSDVLVWIDSIEQRARESLASVK
jgi:hypothetical protein